MIKVYYWLKPVIPRSMQLWLRRKWVLLKRPRYEEVWPIDPRSGHMPDGWTGWPDGKRFAFVLSHDVDTKKGVEKVKQLALAEMELGFRSTFNFVPERYDTSTSLRLWLDKNGFEVAVHGLVHDGKLFFSRKIFKERAQKINYYIREWNASGFHSPSMHRNLEWIHELDIEYDQSTFDTDPFEPQPEGLGTIFPIWIPSRNGRKGYVELPYTLPQDHTLFIIMQENSPDIWKKKLDWIVEKGGMALLNTHPDYMNFDRENVGLEEYPLNLYLEFLNYVKSRYNGDYWHPLPREMARFWGKNMVSDQKDKYA